LPADSELTASILVPLVDADQKRSAGIRRELLGSFLPRASEAELERIALELVIVELTETHDTSDPGTETTW